MSQIGSPIELELNGTLADQSKAVIDAIATGDITPTQGGLLMSTIAAQARIVEVDQLEKRGSGTGSQTSGKAVAMSFLDKRVDALEKEPMSKPTRFLWVDLKAGETEEQAESRVSASKAFLKMTMRCAW